MRSEMVDEQIERRQAVRAVPVNQPDQVPMLRREMSDPSAAIAFAEKSHAPQDIAAAVLTAIRRGSVEVVFPPFAGRVESSVGVDKPPEMRGRVSARTGSA